MIDATTLRTKRKAAGISGGLICKRLGMARSRLSDIERGYLRSSPEELARIEAALEQLIRDKSVIEQTAAALGWPFGAVR
jgi:transcriptional regulator with XRE-family HTH domain